MIDMKFAPIAIFAYNRPIHLQKLLTSLLKNDEVKDSEVSIFVDGHKSDEDAILVKEVLEVVSKFNSEIDIKLHKSEINKGLSASILGGIDYVLENHDSIIVLEDDLQLSKLFLKFCNDGLVRFEDNERIASIQGYSPIKLPEENGSYLIKGADCWGWATWKDRWRSTERNSAKLISDFEDNRLFREFDLKGSFPYSKMLRRQSRGEVDSWAIRWHASMFAQNRMSVYPNRTLVANLGFDGSGTHGLNPLVSREIEDFSSRGEFIFPSTNEIFENKKALGLIIRQNRKKIGTYRYMHPKRVKSKIKRIFLRHKGSQ
jgi:hypothetical protein